MLSKAAHSDMFQDLGYNCAPTEYLWTGNFSQVCLLMHCSEVHSYSGNDACHITTWLARVPPRIHSQDV